MHRGGGACVSHRGAPDCVRDAPCLPVGAASHGSCTRGSQHVRTERQHSPSMPMSAPPGIPPRTPRARAAGRSPSGVSGLAAHGQRLGAVPDAGLRELLQAPRPLPSLQLAGETVCSRAAGGCILLEARVLREIGGFAAIRDALIDDCALAGRVKKHGFRTWIGLTHSARSLRPYPSLQSIWDMVA